MSSTQAHAKRRNWIQFSLRALLAVTAVLGVWLGIRVNAARRQREAVSHVLNVGGSVSYDYHKVDADKPNMFNFKASPPGPDWLRRVLGDEYFQEVVRISLRDKPVTDDDLKELKQFSKLENLDLSNTRITSAGLSHLVELTNLKCLSLWNTRVDDTGLQHLEHLKNLRQLILDGTQVTDAGIKHLEHLNELHEWLGLVDTEVTDAGLEHLVAFTKLKHLNLRRTKVTEDGVRKLQESLPTTDISHGSS